MSVKMKVDVYGMVTSRIIEQLEKGIVPWRRPWAGGGLPKNGVSRKEYRGVNVLLLGCQQYASPYWLSFKQVKAQGGSVIAGEKSSPCVFWNWLEAEDEVDANGKPKKIPFLKHYNVFNAQQTTLAEDPDYKLESKTNNPIGEAERIAAGMPGKPVVEHVGARACYSPMSDIVRMPAMELFNSSEEYYSTLFHELAHATGHEKRLKRETITETAGFGSETYSKEELVAEMGAAFLCGESGISNAVIENQAAYIGNWLERLKDDKRLIVHAAAAGQKASDFILGVRYADDGKSVKDDVPVVVSNIEEKMSAMTSNLSAAGRAVGVLVCRGFAEDVAARCVAARMGGLNVDLVLGEYRGARW